MDMFIFDYGLFLFKALTVLGVIVCIIKMSQSADLKLPIQLKSFNKRHQQQTACLNKSIKRKTPKTKKKKIKQNLYVIDFKGDMRATAVTQLREEITALLSIMTPKDQVMIRLESPGGTIIDYGLAHAQLQRIKRNRNKLTVCVDRVAASGGYLMACVADHIIAAPFAYIGSIGVAMEMVNFHDLLEKNHIKPETITSKKFKRTLTPLSKTTDEARAKVREELGVHQAQFESTISQYRPHLDMDRVATGEYWCAENAIHLGLVDEIGTSDDFIVRSLADHQVYEVKAPVIKTMKQKFFEKALAYVGL